MRWRCPVSVIDSEVSVCFSEGGLMRCCCLFVRSSVCMSVCQSVCRQNAYPKTRFSQKLRSLELWSLLSTYNKSYKEPIIKPLKSKTAEIRHLENGDDFIFLLCTVRLG